MYKDMTLNNSKLKFRVLDAFDEVGGGRGGGWGGKILVDHQSVYERVTSIPTLDMKHLNWQSSK